MKFQAPAILKSISHTSDGGLRIGFTTNELSDEDKLVATKFHQKFGWVLFQENDFQLKDIPKEQAERGEKTPGQRLRASLFRLWQQQNPNLEFEIYYRNKMEKLIEHIKSKLD